jgi:spermidine/putrescine-binding protein
MSASINQVWKIIDAGDESALELRAFYHTNKRKVISKIFKPSSFESIDLMKREFELLASDLNGKGYNIYTAMNPIDPNLQGGSAKDKDILYITNMLIDIDRSGATKNPATDDDIKAAESLAKEVAKHLTDKGWPKPVQVMSGNGWHLYYKLDQLSNDDDTTELIKRVLKQLAKRFNNSEVNIDTVVYNASRITKVPGTIMRKGEETEGRPFRKAAVYE